MLYLFYLSIFFILVCMGIYIFMVLKRESTSVGHPTITHNMDDIKTEIPDFTVPEAQVKKINDANRDQQFSRSLQRIMGIDILETEEDIIEIKQGQDIEDQLELTVEPLVDQEYNHGYYQQLLREKETEESEVSTEDFIDNIKRDKINILLKKAADISNIEKK